MTICVKKIEDTKSEEPIKAKKWKNLAFTKNGKTYLGKFTFSSEVAARKCAEKFEKDAIKDSWMGRVLCANGESFMFREYSHAIQIPWEKDQ